MNYQGFASSSSCRSWDESFARRLASRRAIGTAMSNSRTVRATKAAMNAQRCMVSPELMIVCQPIERLQPEI